MIKVITADALNSLCATASAAPRRRANLNVHEREDASVQRLFIAAEPDTYMRPHRHPQPHKWEFFTVLRGEIHILTFDDEGCLQERVGLSPTTTAAVEVPAGVWHGYACMAPGTVALEVKEGAYIPTAPEDFAPWAPAESSPEAGAYREWMRTATP